MSLIELDVALYRDLANWLREADDLRQRFNRLGYEIPRPLAVVVGNGVRAELSDRISEAMGGDDAEK